MTREATQDERFDRERDYRKHEPRPSESEVLVAAVKRNVQMAEGVAVTLLFAVVVIVLAIFGRPV